MTEIDIFSFVGGLLGKIFCSTAQKTIKTNDKLACQGFLTLFWFSGLFLGFSVLSMFEILYHFSLRLCCLERKNKTKIPSIVVSDTNGVASVKSRLRKLIESYMIMSTVHGFVFLVDKSKHLVEK